MKVINNDDGENNQHALDYSFHLNIVYYGHNEVYLDCLLSSFLDCGLFAK